MIIHDISADILKTPPYPGDPETEYRKIKEIKNGDICNLSAISASLHAGTHIDAPCHFLDGGKTIGELPLDIFIGPCTVQLVFDGILTGEHIDGMELKGISRLLIKSFGKSKLSRSAAYALACEDGIKLIGIDRQSIGAPGEEESVHRALLSAGIIILEGLDLSGVQSGNYHLFAPPVLVGEAEGAFCRALLFE